MISSATANEIENLPECPGFDAGAVARLADFPCRLEANLRPHDDRTVTRSGVINIPSHAEEFQVVSSGLIELSSPLNPKRTIGNARARGISLQVHGPHELVVNEEFDSNVGVALPVKVLRQSKVDAEDVTECWENCVVEVAIWEAVFQERLVAFVPRGRRLARPSWRATRRERR